MSRPDLSAYTGPIVAEASTLLGPLTVEDESVYVDQDMVDVSVCVETAAGRRVAITCKVEDGEPEQWIVAGAAADGPVGFGATLAAAVAEAMKPPAEVPRELELLGIVNRLNAGEPLPVSRLRHVLARFGLDSASPLVVVDENQAGPRPWSVRHDPLRARRQWTAIGPDGRIGADFETRREALLALARDVARVAP